MGFGSVPIDPTTSGFHCWTFKILSIKDDIYFGITEFANSNVNKNCFLYGKSAVYNALSVKGMNSRLATCWRIGYGFHGNKRYHLKSGSVIKMELDVARKELNFYTNTLYLAKTYCDILCTPNNFYKMAIA